MKRFSLVVVAVIGAASFACSASNTPPEPRPVMSAAPAKRGLSDTFTRSYRTEVQKAPDAQDPADVLFSVAPDAARSEAVLTVWAGTHVDASRKALAASQQVLETLGSTGECSGTLRDYSPPRPVGQVVTPDGDEFESGWQAEVAVTVEANLSGLRTVQKRAQRIDQCFGALHALNPDSAPAMKNVGARLGALLIRVDAPHRYRAALLAAKTDQLARLSAPRVAQFHAEDTRCTSRGEVRVVQRSLSGVALDIDFACNNVLPSEFENVQ